MEGNTCFLTAGGSTEIVVLALFLLFPIDTVIFGEQSPFRQSSSGRWQNQTISDGCPSLLSLREGVSWLTIDSQSNHGQEHQTDVGCTSYPHETTKRWISLKRVNQKKYYVCVHFGISFFQIANVYEERPRYSILVERGQGILRLE